MTPQQFIAKWKPVALTERATAQTHFNDLCALVGHEDPVMADPRGEAFTFEKGVAKTGGGDGFADVWKKGFFAWEYKKKKRNLDDALAQLVRYAAALENPPLQVACDTDRFLVRTAFTNNVAKNYEFALDELAEPKNLDILHAVFFDPEKLRPTETRAAVTKEAADKFSAIARRLQGRGTPEATAHFVNQLVFCFFANSVKLLPPDFFPRLLKRAAEQPKNAQRRFDDLFAAMEHGGDFGLEKIAYFNGGLFDGRRALPLDSGDIGLLQAAASLDWSQIDPTIFGTLFERFLDPDKRAQIGAHYTDPEKIMMIVDPVILRPLREEWANVHAQIEGLLSGAIKPGEIRLDVSGRMQAGMQLGQRRRLKPIELAEEVRSQFLERLRRVTILDPACGSGNFLYLALQGVKDIELKANQECEMLGLAPRAPVVGPEIVHGIEINPLAAELARTTIWIGDIQWRLRNGIYALPDPILRKLDAIECRDALITKITSPRARGEVAPTPTSPASGGGQGWGRVRGPLSESERFGPSPAERPPHPDPLPASGAREEARYVEAEWPKAEFIVGNPPFLGAKLMKRKLGVEKTNIYRSIFANRLAGFSDLVCFWFEKARAQILNGATTRVGLVATSSIRGGTNRPVLDKIAHDLTIFSAWSEQPWVVEGARVEVSLICFGARDINLGSLSLDGQKVKNINPDLTTGLDVSSAKRLKENGDVSYLGVQKSGPLDIPGKLARGFMSAPMNPNNQNNSSVLRPYWNGDDLTGRPRDYWLIDIPLGLTESEAALYEGPFQFLKSARYDPDNAEDTRTLVEARAVARDTHARRQWWEPYWPRPELRRTLPTMARCIVTAETAEYRLFIWLRPPVVPDKNLIVIARDDDTTFGVLQSRFHEAWSLRLGTSLEDRPRYTSTTTFETFPFPEGLAPNIPAKDYADDPRAVAIAKAAKRLDDLRNAWLNPPDLVRIEPEVVPGYPDRILPKDVVAAATLRERTLTNLYNQRPQWLLDAHRDLDAAVAAAYGWPADISEEEALAKLLELNLARAAAGKVEADASDAENVEETD